MGRAQRLYHLGDLLHDVFHYRARQQAEFDKLVEARTVEILRRWKTLTVEQRRLLDATLKTGYSLGELRHGLEGLAGFSEADWGQVRAIAGRMLAALDGAKRERREWSTRAWAKHLNCSAAGVPQPATIVRLYDYCQIRKAIPFCRRDAIREVRAARDIETEDGDVVVDSIFDLVTHEILKRVPSAVDITEADLGWYATRDVLKALERPNPVSQFIADQHSLGLTDHLLAKCWDEYPADAEAIGLPRPSRQQAEDSEYLPASTASAASVNSSPKWYKTGPPPQDGWHQTPLVGTQIQLARWLGFKKAETLKARVEKGSLWIMQRSGKSWFCYFRTQEQYSAANAKRVAEVSDSSPQNTAKHRQKP